MKKSLYEIIEKLRHCMDNERSFQNNVCSKFLLLSSPVWHLNNESVDVLYINNFEFCAWTSITLITYNT